MTVEQLGVPAADIGLSMGQAADAVDSVELLATVARDANISTPALDGLADHLRELQG